MTNVFRMRMLALFAVLFLAGSSASAFAARDPFTAPEKSKSPYMYDTAIRRVAVKGVIASDQAALAILRVSQDGPLRVLREKEILRIRYNGVNHSYSLEKVAGRTVVFRGKNGSVYEVPAL